MLRKNQKRQRNNGYEKTRIEEKKIQIINEENGELLKEENIVSIYKNGEKEEQIIEKDIVNNDIKKDSIENDTYLEDISKLHYKDEMKRISNHENFFEKGLYSENENQEENEEELNQPDEEINFENEQVENVENEQVENVENEQVENVENEQVENVENEQVENVENEQVEKEDRTNAENQPENDKKQVVVDIEKQEKNAQQSENIVKSKEKEEETKKLNLEYKQLKKEEKIIKKSKKFRKNIKRNFFNSKKINLMDFGFSNKKDLSLIKIFLASILVFVLFSSLVSVFLYKIYFNHNFDSIGFNQFINDYKELSILSVINLFIYLFSLVMVYLIYRTFNPYYANNKEILKENDLENSKFLSEREIVLGDTFSTFYLSDLKKQNINVESGILISANKIKSGNDMLITLANSIHTMVIGTTGSGKTTGFIQPMIEILSLCKDKPSIIIADPKDELRQNHMNTLIERGYNIMKIDFENLYYSDRWNPFAFTIQLTRELKEILFKEEDELKDRIIKLEEDKYKFITELKELKNKEFNSKKELIDTLIVKRKEIEDQIYLDLININESLFLVDKENPNKQWAENARDFIFGFLYGLWEDLRDGIIKEEQFILFNLYHNIVKNATGQLEKVQEWLATRDKFSPVFGKMQTILNSIGSDATLSSYLSSVGSHLSFFSDKGILALTSKQDLDFADIDNKPTAFFLKIDVANEGRSRLVSLITGQIYKYLNKKARDNKIEGSEKDTVLHRKVYFLLDEFANLPKIPKIDTIMSYSRGIGIRMVPIVQDYQQLENVYGKIGQVIKSQCNITVFLGTRDNKTLEEISKSCGNKTVVNKNISYATKGDISYSKSKGKEPLISPSELNTINSDNNDINRRGNLIILQLNKYPLKTKITPIYRAFDLFEIKKIVGYEEKKAKVFDEENVSYDITEYKTIKANKIIGKIGYEEQQAKEKQEAIKKELEREKRENYFKERHKKGELESKRIELEIKPRIIENLKNKKNSEKVIVNTNIKEEIKKKMLFFEEIEKKLKKILTLKEQEIYSHIFDFDKKIDFLTGLLENQIEYENDYNLEQIKNELVKQFILLQKIENGENVRKYYEEI